MGYLAPEPNTIKMWFYGNNNFTYYIFKTKKVELLS